MRSRPNHSAVILSILAAFLVFMVWAVWHHSDDSPLKTRPTTQQKEE